MVAAKSVGVFQSYVVVIQRGQTAVPQHRAGSPVAGIKVRIGGQVTAGIAFEVDAVSIQRIPDQG